MEGAEAIFFTYLPAEKKDAESTKAKIEKAGAKVSASARIKSSSSADTRVPAVLHHGSRPQGQERREESCR